MCFIKFQMPGSNPQPGFKLVSLFVRGRPILLKTLMQQGFQDQGVPGQAGE